ncbi:RING-H2 finger protein ATL74-like isoform X1 [Nicotiana tomentosiformis]|uniref:RING-H2 finger protein ATL74-like isoform X1 n=1 Tax=Nicotiana tomentosiformis TaxID=4098 RepID=UPI00051AE5DB|nr:RING-H2 finger protein ATL38-like isoform X1 [Nicotiana tomentosiformis]XP_033512531.1 RING-H2 finger protein ATL38-like isoform X1 [Nicotiana tomentosiformis]
MISSGMNLVMTVIGFAVSTMFIVFVCTRLICARIQLNARRRFFANASRSDLSIVSTCSITDLVLERGLHGLEPLAVANFPTKKYGDVFFTSAEDAQCIVCLADYQEQDTLRIMPFCGHSFHATCIDIWFQQHSTCPVCRISLRETPEKKRFMQPLFSSAIRSHYAMDSLNISPNSCLSSAQRHFPRLHDSLRTDSTTDAHCPPEGGRMVVRENGVILNEDTKHSENKQVESPSNA